MELLAGLAILVLLLSLIVPVAVAVRHSTRRRRASVEVRLLTQALNAYHLEYGRWPRSEHGTVDLSWTNCTALIRALTADPVLNPRRIVFLEIPTESLADGTWMDPWGRSYLAAVDGDGDGVVHMELPPGFGPPVTLDIPNEKAVVLSGGADPRKESEWIRSWAP